MRAEEKVNESSREPISRTSSAVPSHNGSERGLIPARMLNEYTYCPRLFYLEWVYREWKDNEDTVQGTAVHTRLSKESGRLPLPDDLAEEDRTTVRSVLLAADGLGLVARIDLVELEGGFVRPVDYKKGAPGPQGPWEPDVVQLCAQGLILKENGYHCDEGIVYYAATRQRFTVPFDGSLISRTLNLLHELRATTDQDTPPPPLMDSPKCPRCSLVGICLPDEVNLLRGESIEEVRRLVPARDDAVPLYVLDQGAVVGRAGERITIRHPDGQTVSIRLLDVTQVSVYGNVQVSAQAMRALSERDVPVFHYTYGGRLVAVTTGVVGLNAQLRCIQHRVADSPERALLLARAVVAGKLKNQRTLLRRNHPDLDPAVLREFSRLVGLAQHATSTDRLFGIEGAGAHLYFRHFATMLRDSMGFEATGRERRPPPDPINALLSFVYGLLVKDALRAVVAVGLDPFRGIYHRLRPGRPSLALDLMEEFRPLAADSVVLWLVNNRVATRDDFIFRGPACAMREGLRRRVVEAYEARMSTLVRHPVFGYQVSYRRAIEVQARLLARAIAGEISAYPAFTTR